MLLSLQRAYVRASEVKLERKLSHQNLAAVVEAYREPGEEEWSVQDRELMSIAQQAGDSAAACVSSISLTTNSTAYALSQQHANVILSHVLVLSGMAALLKEKVLVTTVSAETIPDGLMKTARMAIDKTMATLNESFEPWQEQLSWTEVSTRLAGYRLLSLLSVIIQSQCSSMLYDECCMTDAV